MSFSVHTQDDSEKNATHQKFQKSRVITKNPKSNQLMLMNLDDVESEDWITPLAFCKSHHIINIEAINSATQTWRLKERVNIRVNF